MVKIAFHDTHLGIRGTSVAMYDYANHNEKILGNTSIIVIPVTNAGKNVVSNNVLIKNEQKDQNNPRGVAKFEARFPVFRYNTLEELEQILLNEKCDVLYCIKGGKNDGIVSKKIKTVVHCVFNMTEPHGDIYAGVSSSLAEKFGKSTFVPHMISLEPSKTGENLRKELEIPQDAIVFGRYGGMDTIDIIFCWKAMNLVLTTCPNTYFIFANTPRVIEHPHVKYLPILTTDDDKNKFIQTCDAHIECGSMGHSFGLAIGEFSVNNKPIIAYKGGTILFQDGPSVWNDMHIRILGEKGIYFTNEKEFYHILSNFDKSDYKDKDLNCYRDYSPAKVMAIFKQTFLD